jgi:hypothetical protein
MFPTMKRARVPAAAIAAALFFVSAASAGTVVIDFDDVSAPGAFHQIFPGLQNGPTLEYPEITMEGCVILLDVLFGNGATSGDNICATCDTCTLGDDNPGPPSGLPGLVSGFFTDPVSSIDLDVLNGVGGTSGTFTLRAFDGEGSVVASDSVVAAPFQSPGFVQHLSVSGSGIESFRLTTGLPSGYTFAMDTLVFEVEAAATASGSVDQLTIAKGNFGQLELSWGPSCLATDTDYAIYEGTFGEFSEHQQLFCTTGGAMTKSFFPAGGEDSYYLVVPLGPATEGSYGADSDGTPRPAALSSCRPQQTVPCR